MGMKTATKYLKKPHVQQHNHLFHSFFKSFHLRVGRVGPGIECVTQNARFGVSVYGHRSYRQPMVWKLWTFGGSQRHSELHWKGVPPTGCLLQLSPIFRTDGVGKPQDEIVRNAPFSWLAIQARGLLNKHLFPSEVTV